MNCANAIGKIRWRMVRWLLRPPVSTPHWEYSGIHFTSRDDVRTGKLLPLALKAVQMASSQNLDWICQRRPAGQDCFVDIWPGEHYKLLASLIQELQPKLVLEIGTFTGLSALAMKQNLPEKAHLVTFDIVPWNRLPNTFLRPEDFQDGSLRQEIADLSDEEIARRNAELIRTADFIFVDAPKDGRMEQRLMSHFQEIGLKQGAHLFLDDTRLWNMIALWKSIRQPKIDLTGFGHWSGSGLIEIESGRLI